MHRALLFAFALITSCGGETQTTASPDRLELTQTGELADPCWPIAPMQLVDGDKVLAEMSGDGSMSRVTPSERHFLGRISNDAVLDVHDTPSLTCIHKEIDVVGSGNKGRYDEHDAYVDARMKIEVGEDGTVTFTIGDRPPRASGRILGVTPKTRRTAVLFAMSVIDAQ
jgi:hypothetical protein